MTCNQSAHDRASWVTDQSHHVSSCKIGKVKQGNIIRETVWGPIKKGKYYSGVHRSPVHPTHKAGPMVQLVMGPTRVSITHKQSQRLMGSTWEVEQVCHMAVYPQWRESDRKAKIEGDTSVLNEQAHQWVL